MLKLSMPRNWMPLLAATGLALASFTLTACQRTPEEKAADTVDDVSETVEDAIQPDDPVTETVEKVQETTEEVVYPDES